MRISDWSSDVCSSDLGSPQVSRLDAAGGVTVTRPDQSARGNYAVYDLNRRVITMIGGVTLTQGGNTVNGGRLTITLDTGRAVIDGAAMAGVGTRAARTTHPLHGRGAPRRSDHRTGATNHLSTAESVHHASDEGQQRRIK